MTVAELRERLSDWGVPTKRSDRKPRLVYLYKRVNRCRTIRDNYLDQGNGKKITPRQRRRMKKAFNRAWSIMTEHIEY